MVILCIDQFSRSLPNFDGELPLVLPQDVVHTIVQSLVCHGALDATALKAWRHFNLGPLPLLAGSSTLPTFIQQECSKKQSHSQMQDNEKQVQNGRR